MTDCIKVGRVESVEGYKAKVRFRGKSTTSCWLSVLNNTKEETRETSGGAGDAAFASHKHEIERWTPKIGESVLCILIPNGNGQGFVVGSI